MNLELWHAIEGYIEDVCTMRMIRSRVLYANITDQALLKQRIERRQVEIRQLIERGAT